MIRALLSHSLVYGLTYMIARGTLLVSLLVLPAILAPADYGALAMLTLVGNLAAVVVPLQVAQGLARHHGAAASRREQDLYAGSAWWFTLLTQALFFGLGQAFAGWGTAMVLGDLTYLTAFRIALLVMVLNCLFFFLQSQFRWTFRAGDFVVVSLIYSLLTLGLSIGLALAWPDPLHGVVIGQAIGGAAAVAWGAWRLRARLAAPIDRGRLGEMLGFAVPLVPAALSVSLVLYAARIVLNDIGSLADVGVFAFAGQIASIATLAVVGVQAAMTPLITVHYQDPGTPAALARAFQAFCAVALILCLMLGLFAPEAIAWLGDPDYARAAPLVLMLAPAMLLGEMYVFAPGFWIAKRTGVQAALCVAAAGVAFAAGYALIGAYGLEGAAIGTLAASLLFFASWWLVSGRFYPVPVRWRPLALYVASAGGAGVAAFQLTTPGTPAGIAVKAAALVLAAALAVATGLVPWREGMVAAVSLARRKPPLSPGPSS
jgi:O-antigen/teichoic acid export membrane protein